MQYCRCSSSGHVQTRIVRSMTLPVDEITFKGRKQETRKGGISLSVLNLIPVSDTCNHSLGERRGRPTEDRQTVGQR